MSHADASVVRAFFTAYGCCGVTDPVHDLLDPRPDHGDRMSTSWLDLPADHPFGLTTLPYGVFSTDDPDLRRVGVRIGDHVLDAGVAAEHAGMESGACWTQPTLNDFLSRGPHAWAAARAWLTDGAHRPRPPRRHRAAPAAARPTVTMHLPVEVADYVDFYASEQHATNVGRIFRPDGVALTPNWKHLPIGYHGRAGTVVVSGTDIVRPSGQRKAPADAAPGLRPERAARHRGRAGLRRRRRDRARLPGQRRRGRRAPVRRRAAQRLERPRHPGVGVRPARPVPRQVLRAPVISAWVLPMAALRAARVPLPGQDPEPLPYLRGAADGATYGLDIHCEVRLNGTLVSSPRYADMYWSPTQMLAHLSVNGASLRNGDLFGSGTISGSDPGTRGSLLELTWNGQEPLHAGRRHDPRRSCRTATR